MKITALALAFSLIAGTATAGEWRLVSATATGAVAVDVSSIRAIGAMRAGWAAVLLPATSEGADLMVSRFEWDCANETSTMLTLAFYTEAGMLVAESNYRREPEYMIPDSREQHIFAAVCRNEYLVPDMAGWPSAREVLLDYREAFAGE